MSQLTEIIKDLNLPKQLLDKSEILFKTLFGPSFEELGGLISDQVKFRKFKNQLAIFEKAQVLLKEKNINPKEVSLKVLVPLIEYSSLEEESLQDKWASLISEILGNNNETFFQKNCIEILNKISIYEVNILDSLYDKVRLSRSKNKKSKIDQSMEVGFKASTLYFAVGEEKTIGNFSMNPVDYKICIQNLISFGLLKWDIGVAITAESEANVYDSTLFYMTEYGEKFVKICSGK